MARRSDRTKRINRASAMQGVKTFKKFRAVERRFGKPTAFFQAGHMHGWDEGIRKAAERALAAIDALERRNMILDRAVHSMKKSPSIPRMDDRARRAVQYARSFFNRAEKAAKRLGLRGDAGKPAKTAAKKKPAKKKRK